MSSVTKRKNNAVLKEVMIDELTELFGSVLHINIIKSVALKCDYDIQRTSNALLELTGNVDGTKKKRKNKKKAPGNCNSSLHCSNSNSNCNNSNSNHSNGNKTPNSNNQSNCKKPQNLSCSSLPPNTGSKSKKSQEINRVLKNIQKGYKIVVLLRGVPGCGKSFLAKQLVDSAIGPDSYHNHIFSTDDYFYNRGVYLFDPLKLPDAHNHNHKRAFSAMSRGVSPIIIDNTNVQMWEMKPYAIMATDYGYIIEILEPDTWWSFNDKELTKRNTHNVPKTKINDMLDRYDKNVTPQKLLTAYNLAYKFQKPPQLRLYPPMSYGDHLNFQNGSIPSNYELKHQSSTESSSSAETAENINLMDFDQEISNVQENDNASLSCSKLNTTRSTVDDILMFSEEDHSAFLKPNQYYNNGQTAKELINTTSKDFSKFFDLETAWGVNEKALESWDIVTPVICNEKKASPVTRDMQEFNFLSDTKENCSNTDPNDFKYLLNHQTSSLLLDGVNVIYGQDRDINSGLPQTLPSIPKKSTVDRSCMTEEFDDECNNSPILTLMDLFPNIHKDYLEDLFEKCKQNFSWTVELLLENNHPLLTEHYENYEAKQINNDANTEEESPPPDQENLLEEIKEVKHFKSKNITEQCLELKKSLENKIDINKEYYSNHLLKVKQNKFGGINSVELGPSTSQTENIIIAAENAEDDSDSDLEFEEYLKTSDEDLVEINLGDVCISQLESQFGDSTLIPPRGYLPIIQIPASLARQMYTLYLESVYQQMENQNQVLNGLIKEDEEFAKKLQEKEHKKFKSGIIEEEIPNLQEIMDEQAAVSLYQKDMEQWKNLTAQDLAAKLSRQKLFSIFPTIDQNVLTEILHAHDNDYNKTVEVLIASTGIENISGNRDAIKEPPLSPSTINEMTKAENDCVENSEIDDEEDEEERSPTYYREEANKHLKKREELYQKAQRYYLKGMTEVAQFYSDLAKKETKFFDRANNFAATAFLDQHSKRINGSDTLDLHCLYVKEAIEALDVFIDTNINSLKRKSGYSIETLFVITGRGKNSGGGISRIKPRVISRLKKRNIHFVELNPGLLQIKVKKTSPMTCDLS